ncbi:MAG: galactokinase, partial [Defluviitaleaceae bacterium]|nr:galactokinase [Defluviitaleaceae bacterium]
EENHRVKQAVTALEAGDIATLGELLTQSHTSLRNDYEVSCHELDTIVNYALNHPACKGARMTGAGFGGCAIALVEEIAIPQFIEEVSTSYEKSTSLTPAMHICESGDGAREISLNFAIDAKK